MSKKVPIVAIGLPTYNRPELLRGVLENFRNQTFEDFELLVSDNASSDPRVRALCESVVAEDRRLQYVRHDANHGAVANFWYVYEQTRAPFFMWASDDDVWPLDFVARGVAALKRCPSASAWFGQVENINSGGEVILKYPSFSRFNSGSMKVVDLIRYLCEPEVRGKANLFYSLFRREALSDIVRKFKSWPLVWGLDMAFVYGFLCRNQIVVEDDITFQKRAVTSERSWDVGDPRTYIYPWEEARSYFRSYIAAARGSGYARLTAATLLARWNYDVWYHRKKLKLQVPKASPLKWSEVVLGVGPGEEWPIEGREEDVR